MRPPERSGFTILEIVIATALSAILLGVLYRMLLQGRFVGERVGSRSVASQEARLKLRRMTTEIREGTRLFYPKAGQTADGVGFVNASGETILYYLDKDLIRVNMNSPEKDVEILVRDLSHFRVTTAITGRGRAPSLVNLDLSVGGEREGYEIEVNLITSVFLRSLEKYVPDDPTHESLGIEWDSGGP